jgi:flagellar hook capping protein FlgD
VLRRPLLLSLGLIASLASVSFAATKPRAVVTTIPAGSPQKIVRISPDASQPVCSLGITGPVMNLVDYIVPPEDAYYTLVNQANCPACGAGSGIHVGNVNVSLSFPALPCSVDVEVTLVAANGTGACLSPSTGFVICAPETLRLVAPPGGGLTQFQVPLTCSFTGRAFLKINILETSADCAADGDRPLLATNASCATCTSYNQFGDFIDDLCSVDVGLPGNPVMSIDVPFCALADVPRGPTAGELNLQSFPNPSPAGLTIQFTLPRPAFARLSVYDVAGALVKTLAEGSLASGTHVAVWDRTTSDGGRAKPGLYFYELRTGGVRVARQVVMLQ